MILSESAKLEKFVKLREDYINLLDQNKISKIQFNEKNNDLFKDLNLRPFTKLDSFEKALFNYNYYNTKAKIALHNANKYKIENKFKKFKREENFKLNYYDEKDKATSAMIDFEDSKDLEAYYINLHSRSLGSTIFEINFKKRNKVILHSKNLVIKEKLISRGVFNESACPSLIDSYVNNGNF